MNKQGENKIIPGSSDYENVATTATETEQRKRTREDLSSISEHELSINSQNNPSKQTKPKKKKSKQKPDSLEDPDDVNDNSNSIKAILKQLETINKKLNNVLTKDDRYIHDVIEKTVEKKLSAQRIYAKDEDVIQELVDKLVEKKIDRITASFEKRIEVLECQLFEKSKENENLRQEIKTINSKIEMKQDDAAQTDRDTLYQSDQTRKQINDLEQYTRTNNIRVYGLPDKNAVETPSQTIKAFLKEISEQQTDIDESDIDIAHRLGKFNPNKPRPVIIRFTSRLLKDDVMSLRKSLRQRKIFVNEDLTRLNQEVFTAIRLRGKDEVKSVWTRNGRIMIRRYDDSISPVDFEYYNQWLALTWPNRDGRQ